MDILYNSYRLPLSDLLMKYDCSRNNHMQSVANVCVNLCLSPGYYPAICGQQEGEDMRDIPRAGDKVPRGSPGG